MSRRPLAASLAVDFGPERMRRCYGRYLMPSDAAADLLEDPSAQVLLVGDGPDRPTLKREAGRIGVGDRLHFVGFVTHVRLPAALAHAATRRTAGFGLVSEEHTTKVSISGLRRC